MNAGNHDAGSTADADASTLRALIDGDHPLKMEVASWSATALAGVDRGFDRLAWKRAAEFGVQGLLVPEEYGGRGGTAVNALLTFEGLALGVADAGFSFALASQVFAMQRALCAAGSDAQKQRWLPALCAGDAIGAFAMSEPAAGSDTAAISTTAERRGDDGFILDGEKSWATLAPVCDVAVVFATVDPTLGHWGLTAFLVPTDLPGINRGPVEAKLGMDSCPFGRLRFDACELGPEHLLGAVGAGGGIFSAAVEAERAFLYAAQLGSMERVLHRTIDRARRREQFGQPIGAFQAVSHRIADMKLRHEAARLLVYKAAALFDRGDSVTMAAALAKLQTSELAVQSALDAVRIHGAEGYTVAGGVEADLRDAVGGLAYSGTSEIQRNIIARLLGVDRPVRSPASDPPSASVPPEDPS